jgi:hypothetical protein
LPIRLVTNSVLHSASVRPGGTFRIRASLGAGALRVEVEDDGGPWRSATSHGTGGGRGLVIVDALARSWGMAKNGNAGRAIWFEIRCWTTAVDGHRLRQLRRERGLTQAELAAKAGISQATIGRLDASRAHRAEVGPWPASPPHWANSPPPWPSQCPKRPHPRPVIGRFFNHLAVPGREERRARLGAVVIWWAESRLAVLRRHRAAQVWARPDRRCRLRAGMAPDQPA